MTPNSQRGMDTTRVFGTVTASQHHFPTARKNLCACYYYLRKQCCLGDCDGGIRPNLVAYRDVSVGAGYLDTCTLESSSTHAERHASLADHLAVH